MGDDEADRDARCDEPRLSLDELFAYAPDPAPYAAAGPPAWLDELDLKPAPPFLRMGTHALDLDTWLLRDAFADAELEIRHRLLTEQRDWVLAALPSADEAVLETYDIVAGWLAAHRLPTQPPGRAPDPHPLAAAGELVQEDLCLMVHRDGDWHLDAAVLCFPTLWLLHDKLGRPTAQVHDPVAHYAEELARRVDGFFDRLRVDSPVWRRNLSVKPYPLLFLPATKATQPVGVLVPGDDGSPMWLRSERQTLRRLPRSGAILFAIKVQMTPAATLLARPDRARDLATMYRSWGPTSREYKMGGNDLVPAFLPWLERVGAAR